MAPGGRVGSARQKWFDNSLGRSLAPGSARGVPSGLEPSSA